jgi:large subunit ribosomal protein L35
VWQHRAAARADNHEQDEDMPKQKTHKGTAKRVRLTGTGKLVREHTNNQHKFEHKSSSRKRRISGTGVLSPADTSRMKKLLGL